MMCRRARAELGKEPSTQIRTQITIQGVPCGHQDAKAPDFHCSPGVENLPAHAWDTGSIPGPGRFHVLRGHPALVLQPPSPWATTAAPTHLRAPTSAAGEQPSLAATRERLRAAARTGLRNKYVKRPQGPSGALTGRALVFHPVEASPVSWV